MRSRDRALQTLQQAAAVARGDWRARCLTAIYLFDFLDRLRKDGFPADWLDRLDLELKNLQGFAGFLAGALDTPTTLFDTWQNNAMPDEMEARTGRVYYELWKDLSKDEYYRQARDYLESRLVRNGVMLGNPERALDDGCGSGRYTLALKALGCRHVTGVDISPDSIEFARSMSSFSTNEVEFRQASVLELPFADDSFDFVLSNGVLHHTKSTEQGLREIRRVLKPGGTCFLYLYGGKDSFFWDVVDTCRGMLAEIPQAYVQELMRVLGYPPGRVFHRTDFWYVPVNNRYFESEVEEMLCVAGFKDCRRLARGCEHDWDEIKNTHPDLDSYIYGEGEMRFWIVG